jgi:hypothetical protein
LRDQTRIQNYQTVLKNSSDTLINGPTSEENRRIMDELLNDSPNLELQKLSLQDQEQHIQLQVQSLATQINEFKKNAQLTLNQ